MEFLTQGNKISLNLSKGNSCICELTVLENNVPQNLKLEKYIIHINCSST